MYHQEGSDTLYLGGQAMVYVLTFTNRGVRDLQVQLTLTDFADVYADPQVGYLGRFNLSTLDSLL